MAEPKPPSKFPQSYRTCNECGAVLNVTMLLRGRKYRCHQCGAVFHHLPELAVANATKNQPSFPGPRLMFAGFIIAGLTYAMALVTDVVIDKVTLAILAAGSGIAGVIGILMMRNISKDSAGFSAAVMLALAFGTLLMVIFADNVPDQRFHGIMLALLVWLSFSGISFARFTRHRNLPAVDADGAVRDAAMMPESAKEESRKK